MKLLSRCLAFLIFFTFIPLYASAPHTSPSPTLAPQPTTCIIANFSSTSTKNYKNMTLKLTNNCGKAVDFQNATVTFETKTALNTRFWGDFNPLPYPKNPLRITSTPISNGFLASLHLYFPTRSRDNTNLPAGASIFIKYGTSSDTHVDGTTKVYLQSPTGTGSIQLTNTSSQPTNVSQAYALVHITSNGQKVSDVQLAWNSTQIIRNLAPGNYAIAADSVEDSTGNTYTGRAIPATFTLAADQTANVTVTYSLTPASGKIAVDLQALPAELTGYTGNPMVAIKAAADGSSTSLTVNWNTIATASNLKEGHSYSFSTPVINYNGVQCQPSFVPGTLVASADAPITKLTYACSKVDVATVTLNVSGAPTTLSSLKVTFTPNNSTLPVSQSVPLTNGSGSSPVQLTNGVVYSVSADAVSGYSINFNPQPLTAANGVIETVTLTQSSGGTPVAQHGQLHVCGTKLCDEHNQAYQLRGMSSHGLQWFGEGKCLTPASLDALANDFKANVVRFALYVQEGGYETNPAGFTQQMNSLIAEATKRGIYVIVDWHILSLGDPNYNLTRARQFFTDIATANKGKNNLIYEIANEPNGVSWSVIKSYADQLIPVIRAIDPKTVIIVGTSGWSSLGVSDGKSSQEIIANPVNFSNIMYTFHFYAASHRDTYLNELDRASNALPIFVSEFGTQTYSGDGANDFAMSDRYITLMATKQISWTNWNYSDDFRSGAIWKTGTCPNGPWTDANLKPAGTYIKAKIRG